MLMCVGLGLTQQRAVTAGLHFSAMSLLLTVTKFGLNIGSDAKDFKVCSINSSENGLSYPNGLESVI